MEYTRFVCNLLCTRFVSCKNDISGMWTRRLVLINCALLYCASLQHQGRGQGVHFPSSSQTIFLLWPYIKLLNNLKLTVLLLIVNVHITEIVSRAPRSLICISIGLQLKLHSVPVYEYSHALLLIFPDFPPLRRGANRYTLNYDLGSTCNMYIVQYSVYYMYRLYYCICAVHLYLLLTYVLDKSVH